MTDFTNLHVHSYYSLLDGYNSPTELLAAAKDQGQTSLAITDHGTLSGHRDMQKAALKAGMQPILGLEAYISATDRFDRRGKAKRQDGTDVYNHLILLAKNQTGLRNLQRLSEIGWLEGFYYKPRIDTEVLGENKEGLIVLSACMSGLLSKAIERGDDERLHRYMKWFTDQFGEDFYVEIQPDNPEDLNKGLLQIADEYNVKPIVTADCHFARPEDRWAEEAMLILSTNPTKSSGISIDKSRQIPDIFDRFNYLYPDRKMTFEHLNLYVRGREDIETDMKGKGYDREDIYTNSLEVANKIEGYEFYEGLDLLPRPKVKDPDAILRERVREGMDRLGLTGDPEAEERIEVELGIIEKKEFSPYFIIQSDTVTWARSRDIMVGPGRGSSAGSLVCYCLGITQINPLEYGLLFFRFLDVDRDDWPDIDIDFEDRRRGEVKDYMRRKFENVASIGTFGRFGGKAAIRSAARVYRVPMDQVNKALKIDSPPSQDFMKIFESSDQGKQFIAEWPEVIELAYALKGRIAERGVHPAGVVVSSKPISDYVPMESAIEPDDPTDTRIPMIAYDLEEVAEIGMIKNDYLGLKTLAVISDTLKAVKERFNKDIDLLEIPLTDQSVYDTLSAGHTKGIFQAEQPAYTKLIKDMGVSDFNDLAASNALVRPGAANTIGRDYIARKHGTEQAVYTHDVIKEFTEETFGLIVYQEQVMLACTILGGMTMAEANKVRKIIGKKRDVKEFDQFKEKFISGASQHIDAEAAAHLWHDFEAHADYSFNKSHAVAYSLVTYWTAYLKTHYPLEFMWALLANTTNKKTVTRYLIEAKRLGLKMLLPHVEKSESNYTLEGNAIRFGLSQVKYIGPKVAPKIMAARPFKTYDNLVMIKERKGSGIGARAITALNAIGGAAYADNPLTGTEEENYYEYLGIPRFKTDFIPDNIQEQITPAEDFEEKGIFLVLGIVDTIKRTDRYVRVEILDETGEMGVFHPNSNLEPGQMYLFLISDNRIHKYIPISEINRDNHDSLLKYLRSDGQLKIGPNQQVVLSFSPSKYQKTKNMANVIFTDQEKNLIRALVFDRMFMTAMHKLKPGQVVEPVFSKMDDGALVVKEIHG